MLVEFLVLLVLPLRFLLSGAKTAHPHVQNHVPNRYTKLQLWVRSVGFRDLGGTQAAVLVTWDRYPRPVADDFQTRTIVPMKGKADTLPQSDAWVYELKWDGMRAAIFIGRNADGEPSVRVQSSNGRDVTHSFPDLEPLAELGQHFDALVLDGEIVAFAGSKPSFNRLQSRMHVADRAEAVRRSAITPVVFVAFDLLHLNGHDTMGLPFENRRRLLEQIDDELPCWTVCEQHTDNVQGLLEAVTESGLEGIMAKRKNSIYQPGRRSPDWIKIKPRLRQEFVVGGWLGGQGSRTGGLGSLLVGYYDGNALHYAGRAGSGLTDATQTEWQSLLVDTAICPFEAAPTFPRDKVVHWCEPLHVAEIAFAEWGGDGKHLRHPVVLGRRTDKDPTAVIRES